MANYNFSKDLDLGTKGELVIKKDLESMDGKYLNSNNTNAYDLMMQMPVRGEVGLAMTSYEIKTDVFCKPHNDTANMFVEFECRGKPSGIAVTKASWYVNYYPYLLEAWYIKTDDLKNLIDENDYSKTKGSGDANSNTKGYLIPRYQYKDSFIVRKIPKAWWSEHFD
jgi:hypothetical protein